jgi:hypothetical protein
MVVEVNIVVTLIVDCMPNLRENSLLAHTLVGEAGEYSYYDTWGDGFEIMYHVSTLLPYNTGDRQQIQRKRHIGNDIVCIVFVDGDQPFIPNAIKSQFLHIFVVIHPVTLPDGTRGYTVAITYDEQVPEFGPLLPDPPVFLAPQELRSFLLSKMINGENAAYKAPRLIKPHQRARSGMLDSLVAKANTLTKEKDSDKKMAKQQKAMAAAAATAAAAAAAAKQKTTIPPSPGPSIHLTSQFLTASSSAPPTMSSPAVTPHHDHDHRSCNFNSHQEYQSHQAHPSSYEGDGYFRCCTAPPISPSMSMGVDHHSHLIGNGKAGSSPGHRSPSRTLLGPETTASMFRARRRNSNTDMSKSDSDSAVDKEKESHDLSGIEGGDHLHPTPLRLQRDIGQEGPGHIENLLSPTSPAHSSPMMTPSSTVVSSGEEHHFDTIMPTDEGMFSFGQRDNTSQDCHLNCCCCCAELSSSSANGMATTDHPMVLSNARPISYGSQEFRGVLNQRAARSEASSPVDAQFPLSQGGAPSALTQPRRSLPSLEKTSMTSIEKGDDALGMSNSRFFVCSGVINHK